MNTEHGQLLGGRFARFEGRREEWTRTGLLSSGQVLMNSPNLLATYTSGPDSTKESATRCTLPPDCGGCAQRPVTVVTLMRLQPVLW